MAKTIEELIDVDGRLGRAFIGYLVAVIAAVLWPMIVAGSGPEPSGVLIATSLGVLVVQIGLYLRFALAVGAAARALGATAWHYILWILIAPFVALVPIPVFATVVAVSPLSIKLLLGGQLQTAIREQTSMALHVSV
jgi:hypothetical protein